MGDASKPVGADGDLGARSGGLRRNAYQELFERSADAILIIEEDRFIDCNEATVRMLRYRNKADLLRTHPSELSPPLQPDGRDSYAKANEMIAIAFDKGSHRFEWDHQRADGEVFPVEVLLTAVREGDRRVLHVVWRDITDRKRLEKELRHAQKMEAVGKLAGGIAHDFNNLLVAIVGNNDLLRSKVRDRPQALRHIHEIENAADRAARLVRQLLAFSRKQEVVPRVIEVNALIGGIRSLLERLIGEDIRLLTDLCPNEPRIMADHGQIEQVLLNLASNARDAMPGGGLLSIETRLLEVDDDWIGETELGHGLQVLITVADNGAGMTEEVKRSAFDPFFTTKGTGEGTGLGLATVYGIVQQAGGAITVESAVGQGSIFRIWLPAVVDEAEPDRPAPEDDAASGGTETILVVEDDSSVSNLVVRALRSHGYRVFQAGDGRNGLTAYLSRPEEIDLVLTDLIMPELGGPEMVAEVRRAGHTPRVLFMSGYTEDALARLNRVEEAVDFLEKPFRVRELLRRVRQALDREQSASAVPEVDAGDTP